MKIGIFADIHYNPAHPLPEKDEKLEAIKNYIDSTADCDAVFFLGDMVGADSEEDNERASAIVTHLYQRSNPAIHYVIGNRDAFGMSKEFLLPVADKERGASYSFMLGDILFIALDSCFSQDGQSYTPDGGDWTDSYIPKAELEWLKKLLAGDGFGQAVILCHHRLDWFLNDSERQNPHVVSNAEDVRDILEKSGKVKLVLQAHYHSGGVSERRGITYYTQPAFFDGDGIRVSELTYENGHFSVSPRIG